MKENDKICVPDDRNKGGDVKGSNTKRRRKGWLQKLAAKLKIRFIYESETTTRRVIGIVNTED